MRASSNDASTKTPPFGVPVRYALEFRAAPQAPNCIGGSGGRMLYAPQWGVWGAKPPNGGFGGRSPPAIFFGLKFAFAKIKNEFCEGIC